MQNNSSKNQNKTTITTLFACFNLVMVIWMGAFLLTSVGLIDRILGKKSWLLNGKGSWELYQIHFYIED